MIKDLTKIRMQILFCIERMEGEQVTAAKIAAGLGIAKSTVTRAIDYFQEQKLLEPYQISFTAYGREWIAKYSRYRREISEWLIEQGRMSPEEADEEAIHMILTLQDETIELIIGKQKDEKRECMFCDIDGFCEKCIDYLLEDGRYDISFTIYKDNSHKNMSVSMANDGFYHPGVLEVTNGVGMIRLRSKRMVRPMPVGNGMLAGQVEKMSYLMNHRYEAAVADGSSWIFPTACMKFTYNKGEGILMGSASLKMSSSVGKMYMPESSALFTMVLVIK